MIDWRPRWHRTRRLFRFGLGTCERVATEEAVTPDDADVQDLGPDDSCATPSQIGPAGPDGERGDTWDTGGGRSSGGDAGTWDCQDYDGL